MQVTIRRRLQCAEGEQRSCVVNLSVEIPFIPETGTKIFDSVAEAPLEVLDVLLDISRPPNEQLTVIVASLEVATDYDLVQWVAQYKANGWRAE